MRKHLDEFRLKKKDDKKKKSDFGLRVNKKNFFVEVS